MADIKSSLGIHDFGPWYVELLPEPEYHFETFNENDRKIINSTMIAMLIKLYDEEINSIVIGKKLRQPFTEEEIETGIKMGLTLRNQNKQYKIIK